MDYTTRDTLDIRALAEDDAEDFQRLRLRALKEYPDAFGLSSETVADKLRLAAESQDDFTLGAYRDGELVGMAGFYRDSGGEKMRHKGHVWGMYVASKRQGEGIGRALMRELLARASLLPGLEQVHLAVVTRQEPARSLYASLGFETYGVEPNSLIIDGERLDEAHMVYSVAKRTKEVFHMSYTADISRNNPGCFLFLIDQSGSMGEALGGQPELRKMDGAADAVNRILDAISQRCSQGMDIRDYFDIGVIAYGTDGAGRTKLETALPGTTPEEPFLSVSQVVDAAEVEEREVKESDGAGGIVEVTRKFPVWLRPTAGYGTPMCDALSAASKALKDWTAQHEDSYPPMVINVTDGAATDGNPESLAQEIMALGTNDGNVLIYNAHLSEMSAMPVQYPSDESEVPPDEYAAQMFRMSSVFPDPVVELAAGMGLSVTQGSRGYVYNADMVALVQFLDIGTRAASDLR